MLALYNKTGITTQKLARVLCAVQLGNKIPTVSQLSEMCSSSRGNVQKALSILKDSGAISLEAHGKYGTNLISVNYRELARICGIKQLLGMMPLPYTKRYEGLATSLYTLINGTEFKGFISFSRGSESRVNSMMSGYCNYCVMSCMAFDDYVEMGIPLVKVIDCGPETYVGKHVLITRNDWTKNWDGMRVGVDESSADQRNLTRAYFKGVDAELVSLQYTQIIGMLRNNEIDAGIWNVDDLDTVSDHLATHDLGPAMEHLGDTSAVIAVKEDDALSAHLLREILDVNVLRDIQQEVMTGRMMARY